MTETDVIDAESVEIATVDHHAPGNLFHTNNPVEVVERATQVADALKGVLQRQGLTSSISGRPHVKVEGWTTCGAMLGVVPVVTWTRKTDDGWEARVEARTLDGRVIGAAESSCSRSEKTWAKRDDYALRSMAQTRATSKALRGPLGFIVTLAGYDATPAEEFGSDGRTEPHAEAVVLSPDQRKREAIERLDGLNDPLAFLTGLGVSAKTGDWSVEDVETIHRMLDGLGKSDVPNGLDPA